MAKTARKKMAKANLPRPNGHDPRATRQDLRRQIRDQRDIRGLVGQLRRATDRTDERLAELGTFLKDREERLGSALPGK